MMELEGGRQGDELSPVRRVLIRTETTRLAGDSTGRRGKGWGLEGKERRGGSEVEGEGWRAVYNKNY